MQYARRKERMDDDLQQFIHSTTFWLPVVAMMILLGAAVMWTAVGSLVSLSDPAPIVRGL